ncbi:hypothetical protein C8Q76DRAFT_802420 [Earliella scabrosa]|nr:hypothetical protein C8Q76DRAFT_802420 [Earliella scabrosa]
MSHSPTVSGSPSAVSLDPLARLESLLLSIALPKSKTAKNVTIPLETLRSARDLVALCRKPVERPNVTPEYEKLCIKIDSLAAQLANTTTKVASYAAVAACGPVKSAPPTAPPGGPSDPTQPRYDVIFYQLDPKHPALAKDTPADIHRRLNDAFTRSAVRSDPDAAILRARAVTKLRNGNLRVTMQSSQDIETIWETWETWMPFLSDKLEPLMPEYKVVVHGVPTTYDPNSGFTSLTEAIYTVNAHLPHGSIANVRWMSNRSSEELRKTKSHSSLVLGFESAADANSAIRNRIALDGRILRTQKFHSFPTQCYNCHRFGHLARQCKRPAACGRATTSYTGAHSVEAPMGLSLGTVPYVKESTHGASPDIRDLATCLPSLTRLLHPLDPSSFMQLPPLSPCLPLLNRATVPAVPAAHDDPSPSLSPTLSFNPHICTSPHM